ncbi:MAG: zf-HC2 domain-containing protein [bacterium]|nr:zf-HC2 domain-containing protein [bacterium]
MRCNEVKRLLSAYFDKELPADQSIAVREHLKICRSCMEELEDIERLHKLMGAFPVLEVGPYFETQIIERIEEETRKKRFSFGLKLAIGFVLGGLMLFFITFKNLPREEVAVQTSPVLSTYLQEYYNAHIIKNNPGLVVSVSSFGEGSK